MICAANYARVNNIPYLGICLGMQIAVIEYARYVLNMKEILDYLAANMLHIPE